MKANELRIGNLFQTHTPIAVEAWMLLPESNVVFAPIPLTEEWLIRFGAELEDEWYDINLVEDMSLTICLRTKETGLFHDVYYTGLRNINYVHQLQNLYFALTGSELELTENKTPSI